MLAHVITVPMNERIDECIDIRVRASREESESEFPSDKQETWKLFNFHCACTTTNELT